MLPSKVMETIQSVVPGRQIKSRVANLAENSSPESLARLRDHFPASYVLVHRLGVISVYDDRIIMVDREWIADRMSTDLYEDEKDVLVDVITFVTETTHINTINNVSIFMAASGVVDDIDKGDEEFVGTEDELKGLRLLADGKDPGDLMMDHTGAAGTYLLRLFALAFISEVESSRSFNDEAYRIINEVFESGGKLNEIPEAPKVRQPEDWDF